MNIPKDHIPKFIIAIVVLIVIIFAITNDKNKDDLKFDFSFELNNQDLVVDKEKSEEESSESETKIETATAPETNTTAETASAPAAANTADLCYPYLSGVKDAKYNAVLLNWSQCSGDDFQFYKLVKSGTNSSPSYPNDPVAMSSSNKSTSNYIDKTVARGMTYYYRICVVQRLNKITCGNIVSVTY